MSSLNWLKKIIPAFNNTDKKSSSNLENKSLLKEEAASSLVSNQACISHHRTNFQFQILYFSIRYYAHEL